MPESHDGDIRLKLSIDAKDTKTAAARLKKQFEDIFKSARGAKTNDQFKKLQRSMTDNLKKSEELNKQIETLGEQKIPTKAYEDATKKVSELERKIAGLNRTQKQYEERGDTWSKNYQKIAGFIEKAKTELQSAKKEVQELENSGKAFTFGADSKEFKTAIDQSGELNSKMRLQAEQAISQLRKLGVQVDDTGRKFGVLKSAGAAAMSSLKSAFAELPQRMKAAAIWTLNLAKRFGVLGMRIAKAGISRLKSMFTGATKGSNALNFSLKKLISSLLRYGLGIASITVLFGKLRSAAQDAFQRMAQQIPEVNRSISMMMSAIQNLKNSVGTALQPLLSALAPAISKIINLLSQAIVKIGEFFAALTGQKYVYKATAANIDYAKSLDKSTKAAKKNQNQLGEYDKLQVIGPKDDDSGGGGGAAGGGLGDFQKVPIDPKIANIVDWLKDMWKKADFTELGKLFGEKLRDALNSIPWDYIKHIAGKLGKSLATLLNGFFAVPGLARSIGNTIAQTINTALRFALEFVKNFNFYSFGKFVGELISSSLRNIEWNNLKAFAKRLGDGIAIAIRGLLYTDAPYQIGNALGNLLRAAIDGLYNMVEKMPFELLAKKIVGMIRKFFDEMGEVDETNLNGWQKLGKALSDGLIGILQTLNTILSDEGNRERLTQAITDFLNSIDFVTIIKESKELIGNIATGLVEIVKAAFASDTFRAGLADLAATLGPILAGIFGVKLFAGIAKTVAQGFLTELGTQLATGLASGSVMSSIGSAFTSLGTTISGAMSAAAAALGTSVAVMLGAIGLVIAAIVVWVHNWDDIKEAAGLFVERTKEHFASLKAWFQEHLPNLSELIKTVVGNIKADIEAKISTLKLLIPAAVEIIKSAISAKIEAIKAGIMSKVELIKGIVTTGMTLLRSVIEGGAQIILGVITGDLSKVAEGFRTVFTGIKTFVLGILESIVNGFKNAFTWITTTLGNLASSIANSKLGQVFFGGRSPAPSSPYRGPSTVPHLAKGAVIPPNREFLATLGDQKSGTNIETPLNTMIEAFRTALSEMGGGSSNNQPIVLQLDGRTVAQTVWSEEDKRYKQTGQYRPRTV